MNDDNVLILNIGQYEVGNSELGTLEFASKPEQLTLVASGDLIGIHLPGTITYIPRPDKPIHPYYPHVLELHGALYLGPHGGGGLGATLVPPKMPSFYKPGYRPLFTLVFSCARRFLQDLEDQRALQPGPSVMLGISLEGSVALVAPVPATPEDTHTSQSESTARHLTIGDHVKIVVGQLARVGNVNGDHITVSRSRWGDELTRVGYPQNRSIDLPRIDVGMSIPDVRSAAQLLVEAHRFYINNNYRQAVQLCRQARDALLGEEKKTWASEHLTDALGKQKADMVNDAIWSLKHLGDAASHGDEKNVAVEVDRDTAEYVIGQLTLILHYIDRKLR